MYCWPSQQLLSHYRLLCKPTCFCQWIQIKMVTPAIKFWKLCSNVGWATSGIGNPEWLLTDSGHEILHSFTGWDHEEQSTALAWSKSGVLEFTHRRAELFWATVARVAPTLMWLVGYKERQQLQIMLAHRKALTVASVTTHEQRKLHSQTQKLRSMNDWCPPFLFWKTCSFI